MHWPRFAADSLPRLLACGLILSGICQLRALPASILTSDGSRLNLPPGFNRLVWSESEIGSPVLIADHSNGTVFVFIDSSSEHMIRDRPDHLLFQALDWQDQEVEVVATVPNSTNPKDHIHRLQVGENRLEYLVIGVRQNTYTGTKWFFLIGQEQHFFEGLPEFFVAVEQFSPGTQPLTKSKPVSLYYILAAVALILTNIFMIWLAFRRLAFSSR